jgi:hypothetical protein
MKSSCASQPENRPTIDELLKVPDIAQRVTEVKLTHRYVLVRVFPSGPICLTGVSLFISEHGSPIVFVQQNSNGLRYS